MPDQPVKEKTSAYIPTLDGWRAVAVLSIMALHGRMLGMGTVNDSWLYWHGTLGVRVFFAISGILICGRLLEEEARNGHIDLRAFYVRRAFRILPPAVLYLGVAAIFIAVGHSIEPWKEWWAALTFWRNFLPLLNSHSQGWVTAHYWSLSLEEQFYLLLPFILVFGRRWRRSILATCIVAIFFWATYTAHRSPNVPEYRPDQAMNVLLVPAFAAILLRNQAWRRWIAAAARPWPVYLFLIYLTQGSPFFAWAHIPYHGQLFDQALDFLMTALVLSTALHPGIWLSRVLELAPLRWIGRLSYSLYLWQQLFLTQHFARSESFAWIEKHWLNLPLLFGCAMFSYYMLERPLTRVGHRLTKRPIPGRPSESA
jgi:peptidoglycan/LPS O-acetylase OafA/YrhL